MYRIVIDRRIGKEYLNVSSLWAARVVCNNYKFKAKRIGDTLSKIYVEKGKYNPETHIWETEEVIA